MFGAVFRAASACSFELALMPEPQRHAGTDRGQDEQNQPPVGRHESGQQQDARRTDAAVAANPGTLH
jgi:hypothetical protein